MGARLRWYCAGGRGLGDRVSSATGALRPLCRLIGERHLAVSLEAETRFRTALRKLGYVLPRDGATVSGGRGGGDRGNRG